MLQGIPEKRCRPVLAALGVQLELGHQQRQVLVAVAGRQLAELLVDDGVEDRLHRDVERDERLSPVANSQKALEHLTQRLPSGAVLPRVPGRGRLGKRRVVSICQGLGVVRDALDAAQLVGGLEVGAVDDEGRGGHLSDVEPGHLQDV